MLDNSVVRLSVIIVNYNSLQYLKDCISSIRVFNDIGECLEIIVVDNSTNDETIKWLEKQNDICFIKNNNKGFGQGNNVGAKVAKGEYLLFLNPDTLLIEPVFQYAIQKFEEKPNLGLFGIQLVDANECPNSTYGLRLPLGFVRTMTCNLLVKFKIFIPSVMYTSGADIFIRKSTFMEAGAFDENIFMYCEEADLCNRVNNLGFCNSFFPDRRIKHLEGKTLVTSLYNTYRKQMEARQYYCKKYGIDFSRYAKKEKRYCIFKEYCFLLSRDKIRAEEYKKIVNFIDSLLYL